MCGPRVGPVSARWWFNPEMIIPRNQNMDDLPQNSESSRAAFGAHGRQWCHGKCRFGGGREITPNHWNSLGIIYISAFRQDPPLSLWKLSPHSFAVSWLLWPPPRQARNFTESGFFCRISQNLTHPSHNLAESRRIWQNLAESSMFPGGSR